ncbi:hypothetical protein [Streptomyces albidoflavus]|uniref:hypothetical protein n=1 Tax=Streptomyces albidoflavus TaxID=1886 RepID=UPI00332D77D7
MSSQTIGPVIAIGAITMANQSVFNEQDIDWRIPVATGLAAIAFAGAERLWAPGARMLAWSALVTICLTRVNPGVPSPVQSALLWWERPPRVGKRSRRDRQDTDLAQPFAV